MAEDVRLEGVCCALEDLPAEWRAWFEACIAAAPTFRLLVDWDVVCLASLMVLQLFQVGPSEFLLKISKISDLYLPKPGIIYTSSEVPITIYCLKSEKPNNMPNFAP